MCAAVAQPAVSGVKRSAAEGFQVFETVFLQGTGCRTKKLFSPRFVAANGSIADGIRKAWEILTVLNPASNRASVPRRAFHDTLQSVKLCME
jgi:hypothetical protein